MFDKLFTKLFGQTDQGREGHDSHAHDVDITLSAQKLRSKRKLPTQPKLSESMYRGLPSANAANRTKFEGIKRTADWAQPAYDGRELLTPQQQLNMLYAPHIGPISASTSTDQSWNSHESLGTNQERTLSSYLTKSNQQIISARRGDLDQTKNDEKPNTLRSTTEILFEMSHNSDVEVRECIAENELTPVRALWALSDDASPVVRMKLVLNPRCPIPLLELLATDSEQEVAQRAASVLRKLRTEKHAA